MAEEQLPIPTKSRPRACSNSQISTQDSVLLQEFVKFCSAVRNWIKSNKNNRRSDYNQGALARIKCASFYKQELNCFRELFRSQGCHQSQVKDDVEHLVKACNEIVEKSKTNQTNQTTVSIPEKHIPMNITQKTQNDSMDMDIGFASFQFEKLTNNNFVTPLNSHEIAPGEDSDIESNEYPEPRSDSVINNYTVVEQINQVYSENNYVQNINDPNAAANLLHESSQATTLSTYNINQWSVLSLDTQPIIQPIQLNKVNEEINFLPFDAPGQTNNQATPRDASSEDLYESSSSMRYQFNVECIKEKIAAMWAKTQSLDDHLDENDFTILKTSLQLVNETITTALSKKLDEMMVVKRRTYELNQQQRAKTRINPFDLELTPEQKEAVLKLPTLINKNKATAKRRNEPTERDKKAGLRILPDITDIDFVDPEDLLIPKKLMKWQDVLSEDIPEGGILNRLEGKQ